MKAASLSVTIIFVLCAILATCSFSLEKKGTVGINSGNTGIREQVIDADAFGIHADGISDDGPVIQRMLDEAATAAGPVRLVFPAGKSIRVITARERYVFPLDQASGLSVDGRGCTFLLAPDIRFLRLTSSRAITFRNLNIDFSPLPFADGTVTAVNTNEHYLEVLTIPWVQSPPRGGPTKSDGEQKFFSMLWYAGPYGMISRHYWTKHMEPGSSEGTVRVFADDEYRQFSDIKTGDWKISMPVPGIAHRYGPGACLDIMDNDNVTFENIELWSAPWFGFRIVRCSGEITFRCVNIRPRPGSGRLSSTWRDGFHVKGNSGRLLWEDCILKGMNDDAFNISSHCSRVKKLISKTEIAVLQTYPLEPMPWHEGATITAADFDSRVLLGNARIMKVVNSAEPRQINGKPAAMPVTIQLDQPIEGLAENTMVWEPQTANPDTTLRRCRIENSCRFQSPVTLESCEITAFIWFYGEQVEGPFPSNVVVRDCVLRRGRGNPGLAASFAGRTVQDERPSAIHNVVFESNQVHGSFFMTGVDNVSITDNRFLESGASIRIENCRNIENKGNAFP